MKFQCKPSNNCRISRYVFKLSANKMLQKDRD